MTTEIKCVCGDFYSDHSSSADWRLRVLSIRGGCRVIDCKCEGFELAKEEAK